MHGAFGRRCFLWVSVGLQALALTACASRFTPELDTLTALVSNKATAAPSIPEAMDLRYRYLRVEVPGHPPGLLVLGYVDQHLLGPIEVWYSASREVIKTQNGRIVATVGLRADWHSVRFSQPPAGWDQIPAQGMQFERVRDAMPGYRYAISEQMQVIRQQRVPSIDLSTSLPRVTSQRYQWFRETSASKGESALPDAWFAWGKHRGKYDVVYSEQCLAPDFCLRLQRWPVMEEAR